MLEQGQTYAITWSGDSVKTVTIIAYGIRTPEGQMSRGKFIINISSGTSADAGSVNWKVPWIDSRTFLIKIKGYNASGNPVVSAEHGYEFHPAILSKRKLDGIYLDLHQKIDQRLYVQKDQRIIHIYLVSSSENYLWEPPNIHPAIPHDHAGIFKVLRKEPDHWSNLAHVHMLYALQYLNGHYIHATSANLYHLLGRPASHGCNRLTRYDSKELYEITPVGTRVEVIGPKG